jgi:hypothetical protein
MEEKMEKLSKDLFKDEKIGTNRKTQAGCIATSIGGNMTIHCTLVGGTDMTDVGR